MEIRLSSAEHARTKFGSTPQHTGPCQRSIFAIDQAIARQPLRPRSRCTKVTSSVCPVATASTPKQKCVNAKTPATYFLYNGQKGAFLASSPSTPDGTGTSGNDSTSCAVEAILPPPPGRSWQPLKTRTDASVNNALFIVLFT